MSLEGAVMPDVRRRNSPVAGQPFPAALPRWDLSMVRPAQTTSAARVLLLSGSGHHSGWMFSACGPFGPGVMSNWTFWFSSRER